MFDHAYIVADGVGELERDLYFDLLNSALEMIQDNKTKFLIASRPHDYRLSKYLQHGYKIAVSAQTADVNKYLRRGVSRDENLGLIAGDDPLLLDRIASEISQQCRGL